MIQKQPPRGVHKKRCFENMQQIYRRPPMPKCNFIKLQSNFIEITLRHGCFPVNLLHIFRTPFPRNTSEWLLLVIVLSNHKNNNCKVSISESIISMMWVLHFFGLVLIRRQKSAYLSIVTRGRRSPGGGRGRGPCLPPQLFGYCFLLILRIMKRNWRN